MLSLFLLPSLPQLLLNSCSCDSSIPLAASLPPLHLSLQLLHHHCHCSIVFAASAFCPHLGPSYSKKARKELSREAFIVASEEAARWCLSPFTREQNILLLHTWAEKGVCTRHSLSFRQRSPVSYPPPPITALHLPARESNPHARPLGNQFSGFSRNGWVSNAGW